MMVLFMRFEMFGKIFNTVREQRHLNLGRARIIIMPFETFYQVFFLFGCESHFLFASSVLVLVWKRAAIGKPLLFGIILKYR